MTQKELKEGKTFEFSNEEYQFSIENDDIRSARVLFKKDPRHTWATGFHIWFNGELLHIGKTFKSCEKRLDKLIAKWHLKEIGYYSDY